MRDIATIHQIDPARVRAAGLDAYVDAETYLTRELTYWLHRLRASRRHSGSLVAASCNNQPDLTQAPFGGPLTKRELEVLRLMATGLPRRRISQALVLTQNTVSFHFKNIYAKLGAHSRAEALAALSDLWQDFPKLS